MGLSRFWPFIFRCLVGTSVRTPMTSRGSRRLQRSRSGGGRSGDASGVAGVGRRCFLGDSKELSEAAVGAGHSKRRFLSAHELDTLRAVTARLIPGPPDGTDPGAVEAGSEAIDLLLEPFPRCVGLPTFTRAVLGLRRRTPRRLRGFLASRSARRAGLAYPLEGSRGRLGASSPDRSEASKESSVPGSLTSTCRPESATGSTSSRLRARFRTRCCPTQTTAPARTSSARRWIKR